MRFSSVLPGFSVPFCGRYNVASVSAEVNLRFDGLKSGCAVSPFDAAANERYHQVGARTELKGSEIAASFSSSSSNRQPVHSLLPCREQYVPW